MTTPAPEVLETKTCPRCGGSGRYSFNLLDGDLCYGCGGKGWKYTPKGWAGKLLYDALLTKPTWELQPGDLVWYSWITAHGWGRVVKIDQDGVTILFGGQEHLASGFLTYRVKPSSDERLEALKLAGELQDRLTGKGRPRKADLTGNFTSYYQFPDDTARACTLCREVKPGHQVAFGERRWLQGGIKERHDFGIFCKACRKDN